MLYGHSNFPLLLLLLAYDALLYILLCFRIVQSSLAGLIAAHWLVPGINALRRPDFSELLAY